MTDSNLVVTANSAASLNLTGPNLDRRLLQKRGEVVTPKDFELLSPLRVEYSFPFVPRVTATNGEEVFAAVEAGSNQHRRNRAILDEYTIDGEDLRDIVRIAHRASQRSRKEATERSILADNTERDGDAVVSLAVLGPLIVVLFSSFTVITITGGLYLIHPLIGMILSVFGITFWIMSKINDC